ncbi:1 [Hexamita inflata]|uniref:alpha-amylase n=1 Tax=Hexamita inflata TaxID=28002 RepID=A0AA86PE35_9EUKA|nr:1 [Hexamita inflata] [Hexamita inflata]
MIFLLALNYPAAKEWRKRRVYQLMTDRFAAENEVACKDLRSYCGGTWKALTSKLDYIAGMGYNAIWISPHVEQADNSTGSYHGYWNSDFFAPNPFFGTDDDLKEMIAEAHKRDIWVLSDMIFNHVGNCKGGYYDLTCQVTFPLDEHYHKTCDIHNWEDEEQVMNCRLAGLPDLNQSVPYVTEKLLEWSTRTIEYYGFDGFRIDTVKHVQHDFWKKFNKVAPWYSIGEVYDIENYNNIKAFTAPDEVYTAFNYPFYKGLSDVMTRGNGFWDVSRWFHMAQDTFGDRVRDMGIFIDNHDQARFLEIATMTYGAPTALIMLDNALVLLHTWIGIPYLYYGTEQDMMGTQDPDCRRPLWQYGGYNTTSERYQLIKKLNTLRAKMPFDTLDQSEGAWQDHIYTFMRGDRLLSVISNGQSSIKVQSRFPANARVCDYLEPSHCVNVGSGGAFDVVLNNNKPRIFVKESDL